jgi:MYXO-CTERM domain-containing protein
MGLFVADTNNNRVLVFDVSTGSPDGGQPDSGLPDGGSSFSDGGLGDGGATDDGGATRVVRGPIHDRVGCGCAGSADPGVEGLLGGVALLALVLLRARRTSGV